VEGGSWQLVADLGAGGRWTVDGSSWTVDGGRWTVDGGRVIPWRMTTWGMTPWGMTPWETLLYSVPRRLDGLYPFIGAAFERGNSRSTWPQSGISTLPLI
jgi:hypothetical protein